MKWSLSELREAWKMYKSWTFIHFFTNLSNRWLKRFKLVFHWLFKGYTKEVQWNLNSYLIDIIIFRLRVFADQNRFGYPANLESDEEWQEILEEMIDGFIKMRDEYYGLMPFDKNSEYYIGKKSEIKHHKDFVSLKFNYTEEDKTFIEECRLKQLENDTRTFRLFSKYFKSLWD